MKSSVTVRMAAAVVMFVFLFLFVFGCLGLFGRVAHAYPQYIAKGYANCGSCHYSPSGGGLLNSYGHAIVQSLLPDVVTSEALSGLRQTVAKHDVSGLDDEGNATLQWDVGVDARLLTLRAPTEAAESEPGEDEESESVVVIPMLIEAGGVVAYGPWLAYGTVAPRLRGPDSVGAFSREHWLRFAVSESTAVRAGRLTAPFGLRIPDHTQYTREDLGFDKYQQMYGTQLDHTTDMWTVAAAALLGSMVDEPARLTERGAVTSVGLNTWNRASFGFSVLALRADAHDRMAAAVFGRARLVQRTYVMAEFDVHQKRQRRGDHNRQSGTAALLRAGWFTAEWLDVYVEAGMRDITDADALRKRRIGAGLDWHVLPWVTLSPLVVHEKLASLDGITQAQVQLHVIY